MSFYDRVYDVYVILGHPSSVPIWTESEWARTAILLDPLITNSRDRAAVRTMQLRCGTGSPNQRAISFGRIGWNKNGHRKWVHGDATKGDHQFAPEFLTTEVWAPSWTICQKEQRAPEVFVGVRGESLHGRERLAFRQQIILAVAADYELCDAGCKIAIQISEQVAAVPRAHRRRNWGYRLDHGQWEGNIGDYLVSSPFKPGPIHDWDISLDIFERQWTRF